MLQKEIAFVLYKALERQKKGICYSHIIKIEAKFSFPYKIDNIMTFCLVKTGIS